MNELTLQPKPAKPGSLMYVDPAAVAAAETAKALIQSAYIMAYQNPRSEDQARARILEACKRPVFAERVEYAKPVAGRTIKGPSIRFAELALREWGNIRTETQVIYEDEAIRRIKLTCIDLETNATFAKEIQVNKTVERKKADDREVVGERTNTAGQKVFIVKATDDELHNKEAALISKGLRNEGLRLIPSDIVDDAIEVAKETLRNRDKGDPQAAKKKVLDSFMEIGLKPKDLEKYLGHKMDTVSPAELQDLRGIYRAIKDGEATWKDYTGGLETEPEPPDPAAIAEFDRLLDEHAFIDKAEAELFAKFMAATAKANTINEDALKAAASNEKDFGELWATFVTWKEKHGHKASSTKGKPEKAATGTTEGQEGQSAPNMDELITGLADKGWPLARLVVKFGKNRDQWGDDELKKLADMAAQEAP